MSDSDRSTKLANAVATFRGIGMDDAKAIAQLRTAGFSQGEVAEYFPAAHEVDWSPPVRPESQKKKASTRAERRDETEPLPFLRQAQASSAATSSVRPGAGQPVRLAPSAPHADTAETANQGKEREVLKLSFQYVPLIQCSLPHADPGEAHHYVRKNGWLEVTLTTTHPDIGLPYGVPARLLSMYCVTEALRTKSRDVVLGKSVNDFLKKLGVRISRGASGSKQQYVDQIQRWVRCVFSAHENITDEQGRVGMHLTHVPFVEECVLWWDSDFVAGQGSVLRLSDAFYESVQERSAPLSFSAVRQLSRSAMDLDVYAWLVHRLYGCSRPSVVRWEQLSAQFGHSYERLIDFRRAFRRSLERTLLVYPQANVTLEEQGVLLRPSPPHITPSQRALAH